ncbi:MAG: ATP-dependent RNA helicase [Dinoroseobacter sp.]|nr:ATP-dependent RNA helicase [Dinoroseobacter sp.]
MKQALYDAIAARGYETLTPVQEAVTAPDLTGRDMLVSAQTGSGKTLGFGLAIAPTVLGEEEAFGPAAAPLALIIAPTRELALQVKRELSWLYAGANAQLASCVGGMDMRDERRALARGAHVVVATPGRLRDHITRGSIDLSAIRAVVLDEADEMLDLGFREDLEFILGEAPETRQTLLFSATVPAAIARLAQSYQRDAERVSTAGEKQQHADIEYRALSVSARDAENAIINVLRYYEAPNAIVFANTRAMVNRLTTRLSNRGFPVVALSGELSQSERTHALQAMRDGRARVCVATDVAARGIDLPNLDLVVHAELPSNHETLLHRSGRTGRAGRKGVSALIVPPAVRKKAERILKFAKLKAEWAEAPGAEAVMERDEARMLADESWTQGVTESEAAPVAKLMEAFTPEQIAAAYLRLYHARHSAPEDLSEVDAKPAPRAAFGPSAWYALEGGQAVGAEPRRLLPMLCKAGGLSKEDIGAIRIHHETSFIEIRQSAVAGFEAEIGPEMTVEGAKLSRRDGAPEMGRGPKPERPARNPAPAKPDGTTTPVDWNDAPASKPKKPKPGAEKPRKPRNKDKARAEARPEGVVTKHKPRGAKPAAKPKGPPPPKGKPSSKKNKARTGAANPGARMGGPRRKG